VTEPPPGEPEKKQPTEHPAFPAGFPPELLRRIAESGGSVESIQAAYLEAEATAWNTPIPPAHVVAAYKQAYPEAPREVVAMARSQSEHRQYLERTMIDSDVQVRRRGQIFGFIIAMSIVLVGGALLWHGRSVTGLVTLIAGMTGLVGVFVYAQRREDRERRQKLAALGSAPPWARALPPAEAQPDDGNADGDEEGPAGRL
jgi:uncharacterized membrane protein